MGGGGGGGGGEGASLNKKRNPHGLYPESLRKFQSSLGAVFVMSISVIKLSLGKVSYIFFLANS